MVYILFAQGTEELEFITVMDVLRRAQIETVSVSADPDSLCLKGAHQIPVTLDIKGEDMDLDGCDMIIVPGGMPGVDNLCASETVIDAVRQQFESGGKVAAICAGPLVLAKAGILDGAKVTVYPGFEDTLEEEGAVCTDNIVEVDGQIITSMGPGTAMDFAFAVLESLTDEETADEIRNDMLVV